MLCSTKFTKNQGTGTNSRNGRLWKVRFQARGGIVQVVADLRFRADIVASPRERMRQLSLNASSSSLTELFL
jgi:hypothetical protein